MTDFDINKIACFFFIIAGMYKKHVMIDMVFTAVAIGWLFKSIMIH